MDLNKPRKALYYLHWVRDYYEGKNHHSYDLYSNLAKAYSILQVNDSAEYYLRKTIDGSDLPTLTKLKVYVSQSFIEANKNNCKNSLYFFKKYHNLKDSLNKVQKSTDISRMKNWYELEQKELKNEILLYEKQKQSNLIRILTVATILIFVLLMILFLLYRNNTKKNRELKNLNAVKDKLFSVIGHHLKTPISNLANELKMANNKTLTPDNQQLMLKEFSSVVGQTFGLINNLLIWSKAQLNGIVPKPVNFDSNKEVQSVIEELSAIAKKNE